MPLDQPLEEICAFKCFNGSQYVYRHMSSALQCEMKFGIYLPELKSDDEKLPVLYFLSGLTCTEMNFIEKSGFQRYASQYRVIVVNSDTSPRGVLIDGDNDCYDFGRSAGYYVDATTEKWATNYKMYTYITKELPQVIQKWFPVNPSKQGIFGHSVGGHGAIQIALKNPVYKSISAFAPMCNPSKTPWGVKAFTGYLGEDKSKWLQYDSSELIKTYAGPDIEILIYQGSKDQFLDNQLCPKSLLKTKNDKVRVLYHEQPGYDHSYYFIATFLEDHFRYHCEKLNA